MSFYIDISAEYLEKLNHFPAPKVRNDVDKPSELVKGDSGIFTMNHRGMLNLPTQPRLKIETHAFEALILTGGDHLHMSAIQAAGLWMEIYDVPLFDPGYGMMYDVAQQRLKQEEVRPVYFSMLKEFLLVVIGTGLSQRLYIRYYAA